ncbi:MAG: hypothetical protein AB1896_10305 [Thermodesulfobacteriota bacterium]
MKTTAESPGLRRTVLCRPDDEKGCFRCCPPIRPAGYDHLDHRAFLSREFRDNARRLPDNLASPRTITGFSCWGLGFLDGGPGLVGCLLHPARCQGRDLRDLTGYGDKCRRELCPEAEVLARMPPDTAGFVLNLACGLDSFEYSSPGANPVFRLLRWGPKVIGNLAALEPGGLSREEYRRRWPLLASRLDPARDGYPVELLLERMTLRELAAPGFLAGYEAALARFTAENQPPAPPPNDRRPFVHQLGLPPSLTRFLRTALGRPRATRPEAEELRRKLEMEMRKLRKN